MPTGATTLKLTLQFEPQGSKDGMNVRGFTLTDENYTFGGASDVSVLDVPFFQGDGTTKTAQLLDSSGNTLTSGFDVQSIAADSTVIDPSGYTISATGLVTFTTAPASGA